MAAGAARALIRHACTKILLTCFPIRHRPPRGESWSVQTRAPRRGCFPAISSSSQVPCAYSGIVLKALLLSTYAADAGYTVPFNSVAPCTKHLQTPQQTSTRTESCNPLPGRVDNLGQLAELVAAAQATGQLPADIPISITPRVNQTGCVDINSNSEASAYPMARRCWPGAWKRGCRAGKLESGTVGREEGREGGGHADCK